MSHTIELPEEIYKAIERYAAERGETPEGAISSWAHSLPTRAVQPQVEDMSGYVYDPAEDPLAAFLGTGELTDPDAITRHDEVFGAEAEDADQE